MVIVYTSIDNRPPPPPPMFETFIGINSVNGTGRIGGELLKPTQQLIL